MTIYLLSVLFAAVNMLIVISQPDFFSQEAALVTQLFEQGLPLLHLRKPNASKEEYQELLAKIPTHFHAKIRLHDHFSIAKTYSIGGIHLNSRNQNDEGLEELPKSKSCHHIEELKNIKEFEYVFFSPIFNSISKQGYESKFSPKELEKANAQKLINKKVIALGGVSTENIPLVAHYGFGGFAVLGDLWQSEHVITQFKKIQQLHKIYFPNDERQTN